MDKGEIQQFDTPYNILFHPANEFVTRLVSSEDILQKLKVIRASAVMIPLDMQTKESDTRVNENDDLYAFVNIFSHGKH